MPYTVKERPGWFGEAIFESLAQDCAAGQIHIYVSNVGDDPCAAASASASPSADTGCVSNSVRAFLAIPVRPPALEAFHGLRARLVAEIPAVRWAPAASPHITLHFFGAISDLEATRALEAVRAVMSAQLPLSLRLHGLGSFPSGADPHVLWWGIDGQRARLTACALACRTALRAAGFAVEERRYRAHCTLGRPRPGWAAEARERWRRIATENPTTPAFAADRAILYETVTAPEGVRHVPVEVVALRAAGDDMQRPQSVPLGEDEVVQLDQ